MGELVREPFPICPTWLYWDYQISEFSVLTLFRQALLGLVVNLEKSDLIPSQVATYLGIEVDTLLGLAKPSHKRVTNWISIAEGFNIHHWLQVLGHTVSLEKLVPYGQIRICPIQWQLRINWSQFREKSSELVPIDL